LFGLVAQVKTRKAEEAGGGAWSQAQQRALETALAAHPKGAASDRWAKIAAAVPGKTKVRASLIHLLSMLSI
jgi:hypothetical protein